MSKFLTTVAEAVISAFDLSGESLRAFMRRSRQRSQGRSEAKLRAIRHVEREERQRQITDFEMACSRLLVEERVAVRVEEQRRLRHQAYRSRLRVGLSKGIPGSVLDYSALESDWSQIGGDLESAAAKIARHRKALGQGSAVETHQKDEELIHAG